MKVNEIFYSLQGEGFHAGVPSLFIRLSGCNLHCPFCDTDHTGSTEMSADEIARAAAETPATHVVITGGEPTLQLNADLLKKLRAIGKYIQIETNGTIDVAPEVLDLIDWVTCSPKGKFIPRIARIDELKAVYSAQKGNGDADDGTPDISYYEKTFSDRGIKVWSLQPCDVKDPQLNLRITEAAVAYVKSNPRWRLSLQTHKLISIP